MNITYELTQEDFLQSYLAHRRRNPLSKWFFRLVLSAVFALAVLAILPFLTRTIHPSAFNIGEAIALWGWWAFIVWGLPRWFARQQFQKQPKAHGTRELVADTDGMHLAWNGGSANMSWTNLVRYIETKDQFLVYTSPTCFNIVPKRALSPEQLSDFGSLLREHIAHRSPSAAAAHN